MKPGSAISDKPSGSSTKKKTTEEKNKNKKKPTSENTSLKTLGLDGLSASELMSKYAISGPKAKILNELLNEYKKGSNIDLPNLSKYKELDKDKINKIINQYDKSRKKLKANIDQIKHMDKDELKDKLKISGPKGKVFNQMIDDYRTGKISLTSLTKTKTVPKRLNKEQINQMLVFYEETKKNKKSYSPFRKAKDKNSKITTPTSLTTPTTPSQNSVSSNKNIFKKTLRRSVWQVSKQVMKRNPHWTALLAENQINLDKIKIDNMDLSLINLDALGIENGPLRRSLKWLFK
nr:uncharacterized protein LOC128677670 [Plodia interpunctella]